MKYARIENGEVREVINFDPDGRFHPSIIWTQCPDATAEFDLYDGTAFSKPPPPVLTAADFERGVQAHLDATAQTKGFDSIFTAATYRNDPDPQFAADAAALVTWRSAVWRYCYDQLAAVQAQTRSAPASVEAFVAELPVAP